jgi:hypothetical protein
MDVAEVSTSKLRYSVHPCHSTFSIQALILWSIEISHLFTNWITLCHRADLPGAKFTSTVPLFLTCKFFVDDTNLTRFRRSSSTAINNYLLNFQNILMFLSSGSSSPTTKGVSNSLPLDKAYNYRRLQP